MIPSSTNLVEYRFNKDQKPRSPLEPKKFYQKKKKKEKKKRKKKKAQMLAPNPLRIQNCLAKESKAAPVFLTAHPLPQSPLPFLSPSCSRVCLFLWDPNTNPKVQQGHVGFPLPLPLSFSLRPPLFISTEICLSSFNTCLFTWARPCVSYSFVTDKNCCQP